MDAEGAVDKGRAPAPRPLALVVDRDPAWRTSLRERLEQEDYEVAEAGSRMGALDLLRDRLPDALLCETALPDGEGRELVGHLRQLPGGEGVAVLMVSPRAAVLDKMEALAGGADGCFERKPDWDALLQRLRRLLEGRRADRPRILCVEDFDAAPALLQTLLASAGYAVESLADPTQLEEVLAGFRPDLLLVDTLLPGISGYDLARYLRQDPRYQSLPVLFLASEEHPEARLQGLRAGGDDHLMKPVVPQLLLTAVASHLEKARRISGLLERDGLTQLLTDSAFRDRAKQAYERARRRPGHPLLLLLLELDGFRALGERLGFAAAERALVAFSGMLRGQLRGSDVVGRCAAAEFAVLLERTETEDALRLASRIRDELAAHAHHAPDGGEFRLTVSGGLAALDAARMSFEAWRAAAAEALQRARAQGKNRVLLATGA